MTRRAPIVIRRLALIVAGVLAAGLVAELVLRTVDVVPEVANPLYSFHQSDPVLGWRGRPDVRLRFRRDEFDTVVEHGPDGWRRPDPPPPADATRRVLFLGDSFTWGWGVAQGQVFTDRLQQRLPAVAIVNRGVDGFGTVQEYLLLQRELATAHYDAVAVMFFQNDVADDVDPKSGRRPLFELEGNALVPRNQPPRPLMSPLERLFKEHSRALDLIAFEADQFTRWLGENGHQIDLREGPDDIDYHELPGAAVTMRLLAEMHRLAAAHRAAFVLVYLPQRSEIERLPSRYPYFRAVHAMLRDVAAREAVPFIDLSAPFNAAAQQGRALIYARDEHWTPAGHELAAQVLLDSPLFVVPVGDAATH